MANFHHRKLPDDTALLAGRQPPDELAFPSKQLQIFYNNSSEPWQDPAPHAHQKSDECFIILKGRLIIEVEGVRHTINEREFCCFPAGVYHAVIGVETPIETLMVRAPSVDDKVYRDVATDDDVLA